MNINIQQEAGTIYVNVFFSSSVVVASKDWAVAISRVQVILYAD